MQTELRREGRVDVVMGQKTREERKQEITQASASEEVIIQKLREEREKGGKKEERDADIEIISEQVNENEMEVTEQTEENDWTKVSPKSAARRNNTNKTNKTINNDKKICYYWITDKCKFWTEM